MPHRETEGSPLNRARATQQCHAPCPASSRLLATRAAYPLSHEPGAILGELLVEWDPSCHSPLKSEGNHGVAPSFRIDDRQSCIATPNWLPRRMRSACDVSYWAFSSRTPRETAALDKQRCRVAEKTGAGRDSPAVVLIFLLGTCASTRVPLVLRPTHSAASGISAGDLQLRPGLVSLGGRIAAGLRIDVDDCAAPDFPFEHPAYDSGYVREADHLRRAGELAQFQITRQTRPGVDTDRLRGVHRVDTGESDVAQDEGQDRSEIQARDTAGRDHAAILLCPTRFASV